MEEITPAKTIRNLNIQHPSWKIEAPVFLGKTAKNIKKWKQTRTKLILVTKDIPTHAGVGSRSESELQYIAEGSIDWK
jgi:hypothetical protein